MAVSTAKTGPGGTELLVRPPGAEGTELLVRPSPLRETPKAKIAAVVVAEHRAFFLRQAIEHANRALAGTENGQREMLRARLEAARLERQQFWIDTCREVLQMKVASTQTVELHRHHGCRFCVPSVRQVQHILDALDSALADWDREHPELFFHTLELNFPELLRVSRVHHR